jgi:hypothetical protein
LAALLYDQFGLPCETRYSVGESLHWFEQADIAYMGTWPPVEWSQVGKGLRFSKRFVQPDSRSYRLLIRIFADTDEVPVDPPDWWMRLTMEFFWFFKQQQLFAIAGRKAG